MKPVLVIKSPLRQQYLDYLDEVMYNPHPGFHSMRVQPAEYNTPAEARELSNPQNVNFKEQLERMGRDTKLPLSITEMGHTEPLMGRHVYPFQAFSMNPNIFHSGHEADLPRSYKIGRGNRPRNLQMYAFEGRDTTPQRFAEPNIGGAGNLQTEGIIYGDVDESNILPVFNKPVHYADLRVAARSLFPSSGFTPDQLNQKQQSIARQMMGIGLPPVLTDEHIMVPDITDPHALESIRDDTRQCSQNQQRLNIPTEDLLYAGEPMDIAFQLLKEESEGQLFNEDLFLDYLGDEDLIHYDEMNDKQRAIIDAKMALPPHLFTEGSEMGEDMNRFLFSRSMHEKIPDYHYDDELEYLRHYKDAMESGNFVNDYEKSIEILDNGYEDHPEHPHNVAMSRMHPEFEDRLNTIYRLYSPNFQASEPMDIAFQLLKERVSPEAKRHKLEYDKKYESTPERVKYREELNRERRRRGIYGSHDHKDISHTEGGKLTLEGEHENRARHFKDKGTLREL